MNAKLILSLFVLLVVALAVQADITCNDKGECAGDGPPAADTRCSGCQSCTFKNCCHVRFTVAATKCNIPGWRSDEYKIIHGNDGK